MSLPGPAASKTERQHFVPQSYLRRFRDGRGVLWAYKKTGGTPFATGPRAVAFENRFYDFPPESLADGLAETWSTEETGERLMRRFELELESGLKRLLVEGPVEGILPETKASLAFSMVVQHLRTPTTRRDFAQQSNSFVDALFRDTIETNFPGQGHLAPKMQFSPATWIQFQFRALLDRDVLESFAGPLRMMHWTLCMAPPGASFMTSDNPVSRRNHLSDKGRTFSGFTSPGAEIVYALTPQFALRLRERSHHAPPAAIDRRCVLATRAEVLTMNRIVAANAERFIVGASCDFADVDRFFEVNPELRTSTWDRWTTEVGPIRVETEKGKKRRMRSTIESYINPIPIEWGDAEVMEQA